MSFVPGNSPTFSWKKLNWVCFDIGYSKLPWFIVTFPMNVIILEILRYRVTGETLPIARHTDQVVCMVFERKRQKRTQFLFGLSNGYGSNFEKRRAPFVRIMFVMFIRVCNHRASFLQPPILSQAILSIIMWTKCASEST